MRPAKLAIAGTVLVLAVAAPLLVRHRAATELREKDRVWQHQVDLLAQLSAENKRLSNLVADENLPKQLSAAELSELLNLRNEVSQLRSTIDPMRSETLRIRDALPMLAKDKEFHDDSPTALRPEVPMAVRQSRVAQLRKWLAGRPQEIIPELHFLSEDGWLETAGTQQVSDDDYRQWMTSIRAKAERIFTQMAFSALTQYAQANNDYFPTEVSQLKPYFDYPVEDAIIQRYAIVPAKSLKFLDQDWKGGDWVITQKGPVNEKYDPRVAIGLGTYRGTVRDGRWDSVR